MISTIFTTRELKVINRKLKNHKLSQTDSNYLYKFIRPKLREMASIDAQSMLNKMEYNQKIQHIENIIRKIITANLEKVSSIVIYGSAIQNNYKDYNDIDVLVVTSKNLYRTLGEKYRKTSEIKKQLSKHSIVGDIQIYDKETLVQNYPHSPTLLYQLKDHKVIYGKLELPDKIDLYNANLHMKLDWSDIEDIEPDGLDIYRALRNTILIRLIMHKIIDNKKLNKSLNDEIGKNMVEKLKNNKISKKEKKFILNLLKELSEKTRKEIKGGLWERVKL